MADVVHKSAHPSLPPAVPQQVVQYLLAKNFHLTALELLVEAQQAGHGDDVRDLEAFFSDPDRFPPEELARHQPDNASDLQAIGRERESRLQMTEYELRLAKEDLAEMARKLAQGQKQPQQQVPATDATAAGPSPFSPGAAPQPPAGGSPGPGGSGARLSAGAPVSSGAPNPAEQLALNTAVFAHLLRQGLVTTAMTMEEEYGGPLRPMGHSSSASHGSADSWEHPWELWSWYQVAAAAMAASPVPTASVHAASPDSSAYAPAVAGAELPEGQAGGDSPLMPLGNEPMVAAAVDPDDIIRQFKLDPESDVGLAAGLAEGHPMATGTSTSSPTAVAAAAACDDSEDCSGASQEDEFVKQLRAQAQALREELAETRARARAAVVAAVGHAAAVQRQQQQQHARPPQQQQQQSASLSSRQSPALKPHSYISSDAAVLDLLDLGSSATSGLQSATASVAIPVATGLATKVAAFALPGAAAGPLDRSESKPGPADGRTGDSAAAAQPAGSGKGQGVLEAVERLVAAVPETHGPETASQLQLPPWMRRQEIDPDYHSSLEKLLTGLCDMLPRMVPNLNLKSRIEVLPLLVATAKTTQNWTVRRQLLVAVFNLVPAPDNQQRQAIIDSSLELCRAFGSGWAATELVQLCSRQVSSPSSERRTLAAETLGEAVGVVDPHTQAHVLLTLLSQLAKDRMDQVREAACHSLARLVPRLPFTRSYFATLEGLLLPLATDASEAVHVAALSYLVPALLTWEPQETDSVLVSSCLARVLSEMSQHVRIIEQYQQNFFTKQPQQQQQQQQQQEPPKAAGAAGIPAPSTVDSGANVTSAATSGGFSGSFLRYTHVPPPSPSPPPPAQPPPEGQAGPAVGSVVVAGSGGSNTSLTDLAAGPPSAGQAPLVPQSPPPPPQWVSFGRRSFPSLSHLHLYQLLALYSGLTPALRQAALRTRPAWACPDGTGYDLGGRKPDAGADVVTGNSARPQAGAAGNRRPFKAGSFGSAAAPGTTSSGCAAAATAGALNDVLQLLPSSHRRTASHGSQPVCGGFVPPAITGGLGEGVGEVGQSSVLAGRLSLQTPDRATVQQTPLAKSSVASNISLAKGEACCATEDSAGPGMEARSAVATAATEDISTEGSGPEVTITEDQAQQTNGIDQRTDESVREELEREEDASLAVWASHGSHSSWKTLEWVMQHVVPELIRLVCCAGPMFPEAFDVRWQAACAVAATCSALGAPFTRAAMEPVFLVASGTGAHLTAGTGGSSAAGGVVVPDLDVPVAVRDVCSSVQPRTPEALYMARHCVLPVFMVSVLPSACQLRPYLLQLMGSAHELRQRWLLEALPEYTVAITYTCSQRPDLVPQLLHVLEDLLSGAGSRQAISQAQNTTLGQQHSGSGNAVMTPVAARGTSSSGGAGGGGGGPASTHVGLCCAALARAMVPVASLELASRRLLPGLMALMSYGETELQRACVVVLAELGQRFRDQGSRVSEQVLAVYDSLLEQGSHVVQQEVLAAGTAMAAAAAPSAAVAAAAAAQVEWLLTAVQVVAARITSAGANGNGSAGGPLTVEQQRALAAQLLSALRAVSPFDLRLPRLRANLNSALDSMQRCKALLPDPQQQAALAALLKERPTGPSAAGASISSTPPSLAGAIAPAATTNATPQRTVASQAFPPVFPYASPSASVTSSHTAAMGLSTSITPPTIPAAAGSSGSTGSSSLLYPFSSPAGAAAAQGTLADGIQAGGTGGQLRSRFDAFRQRLMKRRDDAPAGLPSGSTGSAAAGGGGGAGGKPRENFFSDDEGE